MKILRTKHLTFIVFAYRIVRRVDWLWASFLNELMGMRSCKCSSILSFFKYRMYYPCTFLAPISYNNQVLKSSKMSLKYLRRVQAIHELRTIITSETDKFSSDNINIMHYGVNSALRRYNIQVAANCPAFHPLLMHVAHHSPLIFSHSFQYQQCSFLGIFIPSLIMLDRISTIFSFMLENCPSQTPKI